MENKQTAVEWMAEKVGHNSLMSLAEYYEILEQAKAMEKEQKIEFANNYGFDICGYDYERAEQYYKETYGK